MATELVTRIVKCTDTEFVEAKPSSSPYIIGPSHGMILARQDTLAFQNRQAAQFD